MSAEAELEDSAKVKLRVDWGEQVPRLWNARIDFTGCQVNFAKSLGVDADEAAVISQSENTILYEPRTNRVFNSVEILVNGDLNARLQLHIQDRNNPIISAKYTFSLKEILLQKKILPISETNAQIIIQQAPGDSFALKIKHPHLVFEPNELIHLQAFPNYLQTTEAKVGSKIQWAIYRSRSGERISSGSNEISEQNQKSILKQGIPLTVKAPSEGVYNLVVQMESGHQSIAQFVVVSSSKKQPSRLPSKNSSPILVDQFELNNLQDQNALIIRRPRNRFRKSFKSYLKKKSPGLRTGKSSLPWSAYHLKIRNINQPHKLVITCPHHQHSQFGFSILEPDAAGQLVPVGIDVGTYQSSSKISTVLKQDQATSKTEVIFWPRIENPIILFHSLGQSTPSEISRVEVYRLPDLVEKVTAAIGPHSEKKRLVGPYLQKPLLPEIFGATQVLDPNSHRSLDDWQTFYEAGNHLAYYLKHHQFNSVLLAATADGSSLYPSNLLDPTPRYDSGVYHSSGQDVHRKDVLEMLYRIFDREQLALIPELQFSSMITNLEKVIAEDPEKAVGIELINIHGQSWRNSKGSSRGQAPYYNPLNPQVQSEIVKIFTELVTRYKTHSAFQGVAVQLTLNGYLQLPGLKWGYDDLTISQFEKETGVKIPPSRESTKYETRYHFLTTSALPQWTQWRCQKIKELHQRLARILRKERPDARIIFSARELLPSQNKADDIISTLKIGGQFRSVLREMGLDFSDYDQFSNTTVLRPGLYHLNQRRAAIANVINIHSTVDDSFKTRSNGALFYHPPIEIRIPEFDRISPWQPAFTWLVCQASQQGSRNRVRYIHSIAALDPLLIFDGGWTIPFGQEQATHSIRRQLQKLPATPFQAIQATKQPVIARIARGKDKTCYYLVNDFPYPCQVTVQLRIPSKAAIIHLDSDAKVQTRRSANGIQSYTVSLDAFDFQAFEIPDAQVQMLSVDCRVGPGALNHLQAEIDQRKDRLIELHRSMEKSTAVVLQADFEGNTSPDYILAGWEAKSQNKQSWNLDTSEAHSGNVSLVLDREFGNSSLKTNKIPLNQSRYLNMSVWLKTNAKAMQVRIALEAEQNGKLKVQSAIISVDHQWRKYLFRVKDIPSNQIDNAHILIEKLGADKLWIDDVDLQIHQISPEDDRQLTKLVSALSFAWDSQRYLDCHRLLESYWGQFANSPAPQPSTTPRNSGPTKHAKQRGFRKIINR